MTAEATRVLSYEDFAPWARKNAERSIAFDVAQLTEKPLQSLHVVDEDGVIEEAVSYLDGIPELFLLRDAILPAGHSAISIGDTVLYLGPAWGVGPSFFPRVYGAVSSDEMRREVVIENPLPPRITMEEAMFIPFGSKFFGWNFLTLAKFVLVRETLGTRRIPLITLSKTAPGKLELEGIVKILGYEPEVITVNHPYSAMVKRLWAPYSPLGWGHSQGMMVTCARSTEALRRWIGVKDGPQDGSRKKGIYLSRRDASYRQIANEDELAAMLAGYEVEVVQCAGMSLEERVVRFAGAHVVIGGIGSNMLNAMLAPRSAWVIEFVPTPFEVSIRQLSFMLASMGQRYIRVPCESLESEEYYHSRADMRVPASRLRTALDFVY